MYRTPMLDQPAHKIDLVLYCLHCMCYNNGRCVCCSNVYMLASLVGISNKLTIDRKQCARQLPYSKFKNENDHCVEVFIRLTMQI